MKSLISLIPLACSVALPLSALGQTPEVVKDAAKVGQPTGGQTQVQAAATSKPRPKKKGPVNAQLSLPLTGTGLRGTLGWYRAYTASKSQSFFSLGYGNTDLFSRGTAYTVTVIADSDPIDFGSLPFEFDIENGKSQFGGTVLHNLNTIPLRALHFIPSPMFKVKDPCVRILAGYDAQTQTNPQEHLLFGLEYRPHLNAAGAPAAKGNAKSTPKAGSDEERFVGLALATERYTDSVSGTNQTVPAAEYRGRLGIGFKFVTSKARLDKARQNVQAALGQVTQEQAKFQSLASNLASRSKADIADDLASFADTRDNARNLVSRFGLAPQDEDGPNNGLTTQKGLALSALSNDLDRETEPKGSLTIESLQSIAADKTDQLDQLAGIYKSFLGMSDKRAAKSLFKDTPLLSLFMEFDGSYAFKEETLYSRTRSIWSANAKFDLDASNPGLGFIWLRYENGFTRAEPNLRVNALSVTVGFSFP